jgi:hypothetical protein
MPLPQSDAAAQRLRLIVHSFLTRKLKGLAPRDRPAVMVDAHRNEMPRTVELRGVVNLQVGFKVVLDDAFFMRDPSEQHTLLEAALETQYIELRREIDRKLGDGTEELRELKTDFLGRSNQDMARDLHARAIRDLFSSGWSRQDVLGEFPAEDLESPTEADDETIPPMPFDKEHP